MAAVLGSAAPEIPTATNRAVAMDIGRHCRMVGLLLGLTTLEHVSCSHCCGSYVIGQHLGVYVRSTLAAELCNYPARRRAQFARVAHDNVPILISDFRR